MRLHPSTLCRVLLVEPNCCAYLPTGWLCMYKYLGVCKTDHMYKSQGIRNWCNGNGQLINQDNFKLKNKTLLHKYSITKYISNV